MSKRASKNPGSQVSHSAAGSPTTSRVADWMFLQPNILDQMHDAAVVTDLHGIVLGCNRAVADVYGYTAEELTGLNVEVLCHEEDRERLKATVFPTVLETGEFRGEARNRTRAGEYIYVHLSIALLRDEKREPVGMVGFSVDVTAQKLGDLAMQRTGAVEKERDALQASSANMQLLFSAVEKAEDVVLITEAEPVEEPGPRIVYVNKAFERMTGYKCKEILGLTPRILQGANSDRGAIARISTALERWLPIREQLINYRKDGTEFYVDLSIFPIADEKGWYTHWIAIQREVTEQHAVEQRLRESEESYRTLAEAIPQLVWTASGEGTKLFCNQRYLDYTGAGTLRDLDVLWSQYVHPEDQAATLAAWKQALATGEPYSVEYRLRRKDGMYRHFLARASAIRSPDGIIERWLGSSTDIHEQKLAEEALRHTEKLAAAGRLAASLAHEINNPLSAAINSIYIVTLDESLSEGSRAYLAQAEAELARVAHVTTQTLGFFRQSTAPRPADVGAIVDSSLALFSGRFEAHGLELRKLYRRRQDIVCCVDEMRQVLVNLISNSLDAIGSRGRVTVHVGDGWLWNEARTPGIRVTLADNGKGVPKELREKIFDAFVSTKGATGTGLGLWVVQNLVRKHKGSVRMKTSTDARLHGTAISIFLPYPGVA